MWRVESCGRNQKEVFSIARTLMQPKCPGLPTCSSLSTLVEDFSAFFDGKIVKIRDFLKMGTDSVVSLPDTLSSQTQELSHFQPLSPDSVRKLIQTSASKSCELDPLPTWLLKHCLPELSPIITSVVNSSLSSSNVPDRFKIALVRPLLKKPSLDHHLLKNYCPVSNLSFLSKVIEKAVSEQLKQHLKDNSLYDSVQSAYRKFHSTETALLKVHNDILMALDKDCTVVLIMLDLSAAFDTIDHEVLSTRLTERYGVRGQVLDWIRSYLNNRSWRVIVDNHQSKVRDLKYGVPQGSILGPLLFTMYVAPLSDLI